MLVDLNIILVVVRENNVNSDDLVLGKEIMKAARIEKCDRYRSGLQRINLIMI